MKGSQSDSKAEAKATKQDEQQQGRVLGERKKKGLTKIQ